MEKAKSNCLTNSKGLTLHVLFSFTPPPLKTGLNKGYLLICDCSRSWVCRHFHGRPERCKWLIHCLRNVQRIFRRRKGTFNILRRAFFTCTEEKQKLCLYGNFQNTPWPELMCSVKQVATWKGTTICWCYHIGTELNLSFICIISFNRTCL